MTAQLHKDRAFDTGLQDVAAEKAHTANLVEALNIDPKALYTVIQQVAREDRENQARKAEERKQQRAASTFLNVGDDTELAEHLAASEMKGVVYADAEFWRYTKTHWEKIPKHKLSAMVRKLSGEPYGESSKVNISGPRIKSIIEVLADILADPEFFEHASLGINAANCFISCRDGELVQHPHSPEHRQRHTLRGKWEPGTPTAPPEGSLLARLLSGVFKEDPEAEGKIDFLQEAAFVAASNSSTRLHQPKALILYGKRAENGKSQILDMLEGLLPPGAVTSIPPDCFTDDNKILTLVGAALNISGEMSVNAIASDRFKSVITGDRLPARGCHQRSVTQFRPTALHAFAANTLPPFRGGMDRGVKRRLTVLECNRVIPIEERVEGIGRRIAAEEADALLAWALGAAKRILANRLYTEPASSRALVEEWTKTDPALGWIADRVMPPAAPNEFGEDAPLVRMTSAEVYLDFRMWSEGEEGKPPALGQRAFTDRIKAQNLGAKYIPGYNGFRGFEGLRLYEPTDAMKRTRAYISSLPLGSIGRMGG